MTTYPSNARSGEMPSIGATIGLVWFFVLVLSLVAMQVPRADESIPYEFAISNFADLD